MTTALRLMAVLAVGMAAVGCWPASSPMNMAPVPVKGMSLGQQLRPIVPATPPQYNPEDQLSSMNFANAHVLVCKDNPACIEVYLEGNSPLEDETWNFNAKVTYKSAETKGRTMVAPSDTQIQSLPLRPGTYGYSELVTQGPPTGNETGTGTNLTPAYGTAFEGSLRHALLTGVEGQNEYGQSFRAVVSYMVKLMHSQPPKQR